MTWTESGEGTPASPSTWTRDDWVVEKHPFAEKYMVLHSGWLVCIRESLPAAKAVAEGATA